MNMLAVLRKLGFTPSDDAGTFSLNAGPNGMVRAYADDDEWTLCIMTRNEVIHGKIRLTGIELPNPLRAIVAAALTEAKAL